MNVSLLASLLAVAAAADRPEGLYVVHYEAYRSPVESVELQHVDGNWRATADGVSQTVEQGADGELTLALPSGESFSGRRDGQWISGFWKRPAHDYGGQVFSTPMTLTKSAPETWSGTPNPLEEDFHIFHYFGEENGQPFVVIRNPERNAIGASGRYQWEQGDDGTGVFFAGEGDNRWSRSLTYDGEKDEVTSGWSWSADTSLLQRPTPAQAARFYPRVGAFEGLSAVPQLQDGWNVSSLQSAGINEKPLNELIESIATSNPNDARPDLIHSLLVSHNGSLVLEEYFYGYDRDVTHDLRSAGKTYASILAGALINDGLKLNKDTLVMPVLRRQVPSLPTDNNRADITFGHLLSHQSGLACGNGRGENPLGNEETLWNQNEDFWAFTARLPMVSQPGTRYHYCSGSINLAAGVLAYMSGQDLFSLIQTKIMRPLDIPHYHWNVTHNGRAYFGGGGQLRPRDFLKMGQLALDNGRWRGRQIIDPQWLAASLEKTVDITPETTGTTEEEFANDYILSADGLAWHLIDIESEGKLYPTYYASGNGGQLVIVVPKLKLVVGMTGGQYGWGSVWNSWPRRFIGGYIIPAVLAGAKG